MQERRENEGSLDRRKVAPYGIGFGTAFVLDMCFDLVFWKRVVLYAVIALVTFMAYEAVTRFVTRGSDRKTE